jgi:hypothetical protein
MTDFNRYLIEEHGRERERQVEVGKLEVEIRKKKEDEVRRLDE